MQPEIASKIKKVREIKGLSQEYVANKMGISQAAYSKIEKSETNLTMEKLDNIAKILEIPFLDLLTFNERNIFNECKFAGTFGNNSTYNTMPDEMKKVYEDRIKQMDKENEYIKDRIKQMEKENEYIKKIYEERVKELEKENGYFKKIIDKRFLES